MKFPLKHFPALAAAWALFAGSSQAGLHLPGGVPWTGGVVHYVFDAALSGDQQQAYLDGLREYELAANVQFVPRTTQTPYILFKYSPTGPNLYSQGNPHTVEINLLTRGQICHEMGHAFGLEHEHQRPNRDGFITVNYGNIASGDQGAFAILPTGIQFGDYDFESVMHYGRNVYAVNPGTDTIQTKPGYEKYQLRLSNAALSPTDRAHMASLYGAPPVPLSPVVTTTADAGPGSLRAAIYYAQDHPEVTVTFNIPTSDPGYSGGVFTIKPTGSLPPLATNGVTIDATTQPGYSGKPVVFLNGSKLLYDDRFLPGLLFYQANCTVKGLGVQQFPWSGMVMQYQDATGNRVLGCSLGVNAAGTGPAPNAYQGIQISDGAHGNTIGGTGVNERNVLSGSAQYGIWISGANTSGNTILGNYIGTNSDGDAPLTNQAGGIILTGGAHHNTIGGDTPASRNVISGNTDAGIWITGSGVNENTVRGNFIGLNAAGTSALANTFVGMYAIGGASNNLVAGNVISGNVSEGLRIADAGSSGNKVYGNYFGTSASGNSAVPNGFAGVSIIGGATGNHIGDGPGTGNLISGNTTVGLLVADGATSGNFVRNNRIGPDATGGTSITNQFDGIWLTNGSQSTQIGGAATGFANVIAGNSGRGIVLFETPTAGNSFRRNSIFANGWQGIALYNGSNHGQSAPVVSIAVLGTATTVTGTFSGTPLTAHSVEFFSSPDARSFVGDTTVTTNGSGNGVISVTLPAIVAAGRGITATVTSLATGDSSEFSNTVVVTSIDGDNDGLPDAYESVTPGLGSANPLDAALDNDHDGLTNLQEFVAGTNPNASTSRLAAAGALSGAEFQLSINTVTGRFYRVERSSALAGTWEAVAVHVEGTGSPVVIPVPVPPSAPRQFFRVSPGE